jgi:hypothetical protein
MPVPAGCVLTTVGEQERDLLRDLAWRRRKPMYKVLGDLIMEAIQKTEVAQRDVPIITDPGVSYEPTANQD